MKNLSALFNQGVFKVLKESFSLYFKNIFRLLEIVAWITLPASIFFVLIFYWGLPEQALYALGAISYPTVFILLLVLNAALIKTIQATEEGKIVGTLSVYASVFALFGSYLWVLTLAALRIMLWALPFISFCLISLRLNVRAPFWLFSLALLFLAPVFIAVCQYSFSPLAFLIDGRKGSEALAESKKIIKPNFWKFLGNIFVLFLIMTPLDGQIYQWMDKVVTTPLTAMNLFPLLLFNCLINLLAVTVNVFPTVFFYFLYKEFQNQCYLMETTTAK